MASPSVSYLVRITSHEGQAQITNLKINHCATSPLNNFPIKLIMIIKLKVTWLVTIKYFFNRVSLSEIAQGSRRCVCIDIRYSRLVNVLQGAWKGFLIGQEHLSV